MVKLTPVMAAAVTFGSDEHRGTSRIKQALDEMDEVQVEDGKFAPHSEVRVGADEPVGTVDAAHADGANDPGEHGVSEADNYYEGLRDRGLNIVHHAVIASTEEKQ